MIDQLQRWLALEHEAVWLYGLVGGRFEGLRDQAETAWEQHRAGRDHLSRVIGSAGAEPVGAAMGYGAPAVSSAQARAAARDVEQRIVGAALAVSAERSQRRFALARLRQAARAAIAWGGQPVAFPGLD